MKDGSSFHSSVIGFPLDFRSEAPVWRERLLAGTSLLDAEIWESLPSTNTRALEIAGEAEQPVPAVIWAIHQTAGRGRSGKSWLSGTGSLTLSLILEIDTEILPRREWSLLSLHSGMAVCDAIRAFCPSGRIGVKWPNDVYADGRKIAGILVETPRSFEHVSSSRLLSRVVVGIGVNVNNELREAGVPFDRPAITMQDLFPYEAVPLLEFAKEVCTQMIQKTRMVHASTEKTIGGWLSERWLHYCILTGQTVEWTSPNNSSQDSSIRGICEGINPAGELRIRLSDQKEILAGRGSVRLIDEVT